MTIYWPNYYKDFACKAGACLHTCCAGWVIGIDEESLKRFSKDPEVSGTISDGCFVLKEDGRCPYLRDDNLCEMIIRHGEDYLCDICREHPRFYNDFEDHIEAGIGLVCEEACRLVLDADAPFCLVSDDGSKMELPDYVKAVFDTMIAGYVCNKIEGKADFERLYVSVTSLAYPIEEQQEAKQLSLFDEPSEDEGKAVVTAALKLYANMVIAKVLKRDIDKDEQIKKLLYDIEFPLVITLDSIERCGMNVSWERLNRLHEEYSRRLEDTCARIYDLSGFEFNINSPKQLADVLFAEDKLALPHGKKNKTGVYSTDIDELNRLKYMHPVIKYIIEYRELSKLDSTYAVGLVKAIADDGRIHTRFTQAMTNTGRLSSTEPNLQNIPVRSVEGSRLREAFTAPEGRVLVDADYSQIELRLLAALSEDPIMCDAFMKGEDIHRRTAAKVFGVDESEVTPKMRAQAKTVNFSIIYGISDYGLSNDLDIGIKDAGNLIKEYGNQFPGIMNYLDRLKEEGMSKGYAETYYGRRRNLTELKSQNRNLRNFGLRAAMNTPIQGTAADVIKIAMNRAYRALREELPDSLLVMQVHDELIVECDEKDAAKASEILKREMEAAAEFKVPLVADVHTGKDWLRAK